VVVHPERETNSRTVFHQWTKPSKAFKNKMTLEFGPKRLSSAKRREHRLFDQIVACNSSGKRRKTAHHQQKYLQSYDARLVATVAAYRAMKPWRRPAIGRLPEIASELNAWRGTQEKVALRWKPKKNDPHSFRPILEFGIEHRSLQYLVREGLRARCSLDPNQYATHGGREAAIASVRDAMLAGYQHIAEIDIKSFFPNIIEKGALELLPIHRRVIEVVILSKHLNFAPCNLLFGGDASPEKDDALGGNIAEARRGIPQGSATSSLVAEALLAPVLAQISVCGPVISYSDNFLVFGKSKQEVVSMIKALRSALTAHPAGPFTPNEPKIYSPEQSVGFLGYSVRLTSNKFDVEPAERHLSNLAVAFDRRLERALAGHSDSRARQLEELRRFVVGWTNAFRLWPLAQKCRSSYLATISAAAGAVHQ
jgi:hypothetical protein